MKKFLFFIVLCMCALIVTGCKEKNKVKLDSLSNTYWESRYDSKNYSKVWFYSNGDSKYIICASGQATDYSLKWTCSSYGYVDLYMKLLNKKSTIVSGSFDGDNCSLTLGKLDYEYKGKAQ